MKMVLAGNWRWRMYEESFSLALEGLGVDVLPFKWHKYFKSLLGRFEDWSLIKISNIRRLNKDLLDFCVITRPDIVFIWRGIHILPDTLIKIKRKTGAFLVSYNNDDPFSNRYLKGGLHNRRLWTNFFSCLPLYDYNFAYRKKNVNDYIASGVKNVDVLLPYYDKDLHFPMSEPRGKCSEGVFIGHYEADERFGCIGALRKQGVKVDIFGTDWDKCSEPGFSTKGIIPVHNEMYNISLNKYFFALAFYSKLNNDTYTRRVFEIPATGTLLVGRRTNDVQEFFKDGEEAIFFDDKNELVKRMTYLLDNKDELADIANAGYLRAISSGYDVKSRMKEMLDVIISKL